MPEPQFTKTLNSKGNANASIDLQSASIDIWDKKYR